MSINEEKYFKGKDQSFVRAETKGPDQNWGLGRLPDVGIELKFEEWKGACEGSGEARTSCKDGGTGEEKSRNKGKAQSRLGRVAGGVKAGGGGEGVQNMVKAGGSEEKEVNLGGGRREMSRPWWP